MSALEGIKSASCRQMLFLRDLLPFQQARLRGFRCPRHQQVGMLSCTQVAATRCTSRASSGFEGSCCND